MRDGCRALMQFMSKIGHPRQWVSRAEVESIGSGFEPREAYKPPGQSLNSASRCRFFSQITPMILVRSVVDPAAAGRQ